MPYPMHDIGYEKKTNVFKPEVVTSTRTQYRPVARGNARSTAGTWSTYQRIKPEVEK